jgi:hypothetical protein
MTRDLWNAVYAARFMEALGCDEEFALEAARQADDEFNDGEDPNDSAIEELSNWTDDEGPE